MSILRIPVMWNSIFNKTVMCAQCADFRHLINSSQFVLNGLNLILMLSKVKLFVLSKQESYFEIPPVDNTQYYILLHLIHPYLHLYRLGTPLCTGYTYTLNTPLYTRYTIIHWTTLYTEYTLLHSTYPVHKSFDKLVEIFRPHMIKMLIRNTIRLTITIR